MKRHKDPDHRAKPTKPHRPKVDYDRHDKSWQDDWENDDVTTTEDEYATATIIVPSKALKKIVEKKKHLAPGRLIREWDAIAPEKRRLGVIIELLSSQFTWTDTPEQQLYTTRYLPYDSVFEVFDVMIYFEYLCQNELCKATFICPPGPTHCYKCGHKYIKKTALVKLKPTKDGEWKLVARVPTLKEAAEGEDAKRET